VRFGLASLSRLIVGDRQANRVVPPSGFTAQLTLFSSAAMAFLAVFALALSLASGRLAAQWGQELAQTATIRIVAPADQRATQTKAALHVLETTPGVMAARALSNEEQEALLAPWFGQDLPLETLPVPRLIEVVTGGTFDPTGLRLRLAAEVPGAVLDDHGRWRAPLVIAAKRLRMLGWASAVLIIAAVAAMVTLAAHAALSANQQVIAVLRLVGAKDNYIAQAFVRRFTLRAFAGSAVGMVVGLGAVSLISANSGEAAGFLTGIGFQGAGWLVPLAVPLISGFVALAATAYAASRALGRLR